MKRLRILHRSEYCYNEPVEFGEHRAMIRPREGHDLHIITGKLTVEPKATVNWIRDFTGNSIAVMNFQEPGERLIVASEVLVEQHSVEPFTCPIKSSAEKFPFKYPEHEQIEIQPYLIPSYPHDAPKIQDWLIALHKPGETHATHELLNALNSRIFEVFKYVHREEPGVQLPCETLEKGSGSCRDFAVFMMEAARHWGLAARFVTGYIQMGEGQHGATHAWTEIYVPGAGWLGFDPTNNKPAGTEHVTAGVARSQEKAAPLAGSWSGPADAFQSLNVVVTVEAA